MKAILFLLFTTLFSTSLFSQNFSWAQSWGSDGYDRGTAVDTDLDGNVYTAGTFNGTVDFDAGQGVVNLTSDGDDVFIKKTDRYGNLIWVKQFSGIAEQSASDIEVSDEGDVYITGNFLGIADFDPSSATFLLNAAAGRCYVCKLTTNGHFVWAKQFSGTAYTKAIALDSDNNVLTVGNFSGMSDFDPGNGQSILDGSVSSMFISKLDEDGNYVWAKHFAKNDSDTLLNTIHSVAVDAAGNVYTTGGFEDTIDFDPGTGIHELFPQGMDVFLSKLDVNGNFVWVKQFGSDTYDRGISLALDEDANIYTVGSFSGVVDLDPGAGTSTLTSGTYNWPDSSYHVINLYLSKFDTDGNFVWTKGMVGNGDIIGMKVELNSAGEIYTGGYFNRTVDLDPGAGEEIVSTTGTLDFANDIFAARLDQSGNLLWAEAFGSEDHDVLNDLTVDTDANLYILGNFEQTVDFDPGSGVWNLTEDNPSSETFDIFLAKFNDCLPTQSLETVAHDCNEEYTWAVNDEVYTMSGIYHYVLANADGCDSIITLDLEIPVLDVVYENIDGTLTYTNPQPGDAYQWVDCSNDVIIAGATEATFTPAQTANYLLIVTNGTCSAPSPCIPFTFVGLDEIDAASIHLYPNPVQDQFTITVDNGSPLLAVEITAVSGQLVYRAWNPGNTFSSGYWEAGVYLVKAVTEKGNHTFRVIKK